jgi:hypothetical protein
MKHGCWFVVAVRLTVVIAPWILMTLSSSFSLLFLHPVPISSCCECFLMYFFLTEILCNCSGGGDKKELGGIGGGYDKLFCGITTGLLMIGLDELEKENQEDDKDEEEEEEEEDVSVS